MKPPTATDASLAAESAAAPPVTATVEAAATESTVAEAQPVVVAATASSYIGAALTRTDSTNSIEVIADYTFFFDGRYLILNHRMFSLLLLFLLIFCRLVLVEPTSYIVYVVIGSSMCF